MAVKRLSSTDKVNPPPQRKTPATASQGSPARGFQGEIPDTFLAPLEILKPHPQNARVHSEVNIQAIMKSLDTFGQNSPIIINAKNVVLVGNGRLEAARRLGWKEVRCWRVTHLTEAQETAYALADNKTSDLSEFDYRMVSDLIKGMGKEVDVGTTGFQDFELEVLLEGDFNPAKTTKGLEEFEDDDSERGKGAKVTFPASMWGDIVAVLGETEDYALAIYNRIVRGE